MKTNKISLLLLLLLGSAGAAFAQRGDYEITAILPAVVHTPQYAGSFDNKPGPKIGEWLQVEVRFQSRPDFTDELTFKYYILFSGQVLEGEVTHVNISKGRELYSVMYLAPNTIARLLDNHPLTGAEIENVGVQILNKGQLVAEKSFKPAGADEWWQQMQQVTGLLLNKNETPFSVLYWDKYEAIKPPSH